jgi:hypothetical protein
MDETLLFYEMFDCKTWFQPLSGYGGHRNLKFYYVYILQSVIDRKRFYAGFTHS